MHCVLIKIKTRCVASATRFLLDAQINERYVDACDAASFTHPARTAVSRKSCPQSNRGFFQWASKSCQFLLQKSPRRPRSDDDPSLSPGSQSLVVSPRSYPCQGWIQGKRPTLRAHVLAFHVLLMWVRVWRCSARIHGWVLCLTRSKRAATQCKVDL